MHLYKDCTIIEITFNSNLQLIVLISEGYEYSRKAIVLVLIYLRACSIYWTDWCLKSVFLKVVGQNSSIKCFWVRPNLMALIHKESSNAAVLMSLLVSNPMTLVCSSFCWPRNSSFMTDLMIVNIGESWDLIQCKEHWDKVVWIAWSAPNGLWCWTSPGLDYGRVVV